MGKKENREPPRTTEQLRQVSDYYKLNTKSVEDLVNANPENSPPVSQEELDKYRSKGGIHLPRWLKAVGLKAWFAGSVCFFVFWGLGLYLTHFLDMMLVFAVALGMVTDLLVNSILRFAASVPGENDGWMLFPKKGLAAFFCNIGYAFVLLGCVYGLYQLLNGAIVALTGQTDSVPVGVEPILFGLFYTGFDLLFLGMKHLARRILDDARAGVRGGRNPG